MKYFVVLVSLLNPLTSLASDLPESMSTRLEENLAASLFQVGMADTCPKLRADPGVQDRLLDKMKKNSEFGMKANHYTQYAGSLATMGGFAGAYIMVNIMYDVNVHGAFTLIPAASSAAASVAGSMAVYYDRKDKDPANTEFVLNQDRLQEHAAKLAKRTAVVLSLGKGEEATIRAAILAEVRKKAQAGDKSPLRYFDLLRKATFKKELVLSPEKAALLEKIESYAPASPAKPLTDTEKTLTLALANDFLGECLKEMPNDTPRENAVKLRIAKNKEILSEIKDYGLSRPAAAEPADKSSIDAE